MHIVTDEQQPPATEQKEKPKAPKLSKNQFRAIANKETMINGKAFEDCSRWELFQIIMSLLNNVGILHRENVMLKQKYEPGEALPLTEEMAEQVLKVVDELTPRLEEAEIVEAREEEPK